MRWLGIYRTTHCPAPLIDAFINEPLLEQRLGIAIVPQRIDLQHAGKSGAMWCGHPFPATTRRAVRAVQSASAADLISSLHPETKSCVYQ
jgi:hypothetical protein